MTQLNSTQLKQVFQEAIEGGDNDLMKKLLKEVLQMFLEYERTEQINASKYERSDDRQGSRNGHKDRSLGTRFGTLDLKKPQIREFPFTTRLFDEYQRTEKALLVALQQMVINGVSTAKVKNITKKLSGGLGFSKSTVSRFMQELDPAIDKWRKRLLKGHYEYLISDACYFHVRENKQVVKLPLLVTIGIDADGRRSILGADMAINESEQTWREHHEALKHRGIQSAGLTISDHHGGLVRVLEEVYSPAPHQRCMVHFERNLLAKVPYKEKSVLSKYVKQIYSSPTKEMALKISGMVSDRYRTKHPKVSKLLDEHVEETLTYFEYPQNHRRKIRTTNLIEGTLNSQLKRRSKVVGIFPNRESCIRYACALLMEIDEDWQTGRKYMKIEKNRSESPDSEQLLEDIKQIKQSEEVMAC